MSENKNTLAKGMFVREHTFNSGTKVLNVSINVADFCSFVKDNMNEDSNGNQWVNLKLIPNKNVGENKLSHTPILNDYVRKTGEQALEELAKESGVVTPSAAEREITETPTKKSKVKTVKKAIKKAIKAVKGDDLPF
jgi:phage tail sheath gpL-like